MGDAFLVGASVSMSSTTHAITTVLARGTIGGAFNIQFDRLAALPARGWTEIGRVCTLDIFEKVIAIGHIPCLRFTLCKNLVSLKQFASKLK